MNNVKNIIKEVVADFVNEKLGNVRKLSPNASVQDKINMLMLISQKAHELYYTRKHSQEWVYKVREKYGYYWDELYEQIRHTPEWEAYSKANDVALNINFGDMLA